MKDLKLVKVKALVAFTKTTKHGQFHGDPGSDRNATPRVPDYVVEELVRAKLIADPAKEQLDHDGDGAPGGSRKGARSTRARGAAKAKEVADDTSGKSLPPVEDGPYSAKHVQFGKYEITGPDGFSETMKGKAAVQQRVAELNSAAEKSAGGDAPID